MNFLDRLIMPATLLLYLDPGSGSFLIQLLLGAGLSLAVAGKLFWGRIKEILTGKKEEPTAVSEETDESDQ
jgi:hypothetical protein